MPIPDFERAKQYALIRLEQELSPLLKYHGISHTRDDVLPAAERLAEMEGVTLEDLLLLRTAAWYHDIGFVVQYEDNEPYAAAIARENLPIFGYSPSQVQTIAEMIMATRLPQSPKTRLEEILADADLDSLGRQDYWSLSKALRIEQETFVRTVSDRDWLSFQLAFLQGHRFFTKSARELREPKKQEHIRELLKQIRELDQQS